jgi:DASS family divalent anion:Na+ symporter
MSNDNISNKWKGAKLVPLFVLSLFFLILWFVVPAPTGLNLKSWHLFIIFITTIFSLIIKPLPMGAMCLSGACMCVLTDTIPLAQVLSSFGSSIVWLIVSAFLLARGFIKTGLGSRIAYHFITFLGKSTLGLSYGLILTEVLFAPVTPSNTARGAGIVYPIIIGLSKEYGSSPEDGTQKRIGAFLVKLLYQVNTVTSAMFITATAGNPLIVSLAAGQGVEITWGMWALACIVPGVINLICLPLLFYVVYPPQLKKTPEAPEFARKKLDSLGSMSNDEILMLVVFAFLLILWVFGSQIGIDATTAGLCGLLILLITGVLKWDDIIKEKSAWDTFIWMAILIMLSSKLSAYGVTDWFGQYMKAAVSDFHWLTAMIVMGSLYYYAHYFFASMTAHISALYVTFIMACISAGSPVVLAAFFLGAASSLSAGLTHYGTGSGPVYFGSNYVSLADWWRVGFIVSVFNILLWGTVGTFWWQFLGYW